MSKETRKFKGVWIPAQMWLDRTLSINEKVMLIEIDSLEDEERGCFAQNARFAEFFGLSISRVSEIISGLEKRGLISITHIRNGKQIVERQIRIVRTEGMEAPPSENRRAFEKRGEPLRKTEAPPSEKAQESNTSLSNTGSNTESPPIASPEGDIDVPVTRKTGPGEDAFELAWGFYPKRAGGNSKANARKAWAARVAAGVKPDAMLAGVQRYAAYCKATRKVGTEYVKQAASFFGPGEHWQEDWATPAKPANDNNSGRHHGFNDIDYSAGIDDDGNIQLRS